MFVFSECKWDRPAPSVYFSIVHNLVLILVLCVLTNDSLHSVIEDLPSL